MADQYGLIPLPLGVPFDPAATEQPFQPAEIFGGFIAGWEQAGAAQTLSAQLFQNAQTFYSTTVNRGSVTLVAGLVSNDQTFFTATVNKGAVSIAPSRVDNLQTFYAATVSSGAATLVVPRYDNAQTFYSATVAPGAISLTPERYDNVETFYAPAVVRGAVTLAAPLLSNAQTFYAPTVAQGAIALQPELYTNTQSFYGPTVTTLNALTPEPFINTQTFDAATVNVDGQTQSRSQGWILQQKRKRSFSEESQEQEQLRKTIEQAVDPITEKTAQVVTVKGDVAVVTESQTIPLPVPPQFDAQVVAKMAAAVLEAQGIEAQRVRDAKNRRKAEMALQVLRAEMERKRFKRRRDEELMLLM